MPPFSASVSRCRAHVAFVYFSKKVEVMSVEMESLVTDLLSKLLLRPDCRRNTCRETASQRRASRSRDKEITLMKFAVRKKRAPSIIIVSLVDILTILLIFFVVSTTFKTGSAGSADQSAGLKTASKPAKRDRTCDRHCGPNDEIKLDGNHGDRTAGAGGARPARHPTFGAGPAGGQEGVVRDHSLR